MATATTSYGVYQIGEMAGTVWQVLHDNGPTALTTLLKEIDAPRELVLMSLGWLAREDKVMIEERGRKKMVSLIEP